MQSLDGQTALVEEKGFPKKHSPNLGSVRQPDRNAILQLRKHSGPNVQSKCAVQMCDPNVRAQMCALNVRP